MVNEKMREFLMKKIDFHSQHSKYMIPENRKEVHKAKGEAYVQALEELESIAEAEKPETITLQVKSLKDERMKPEVPEAVAEFIEKMRDHYITPRFYETPENEAAVLAYYATRFLFDDGRKSDKTIVLMNKMNEWLLDRNNFFVLIDAIKHGYVVKKEYYYIRMPKEVAKAVKPMDISGRYLKVREADGAWYFGRKEITLASNKTIFTEEEKDYWMEKLKAVALESVKMHKDLIEDALD